MARPSQSGAGLTMVDAETLLAMGQEKLGAIAQGTIAKLGGTTDDPGSANWTDAK